MSLLLSRVRAVPKYAQWVQSFSTTSTKAAYGNSSWWRGEDRGQARDQNRGGFNRRQNSFDRGRRSGGFDRPGNSRSQFGRKRRDGGDDDALLTRTRHSARKEDGLMGLPDYELDREAVATLKWTDLVDEGAEEASGMSSVPTAQLAERRILSRPLVNSLIHNRKYERLTPVQAQTLLPILRNESVVVRAKTGTGKTAAFAIPTIQKVLEAHNSNSASSKVKAVIVTPTRELAQQIADEIFKITQFGGLAHVTVQSLVGGLSKDRQMREAGLVGRGKPADIIVATPGRLLDVLQDDGVAERFDSLQFRVFDEADRILDIGFEREIQQITEIIEDARSRGDFANKETPLLLFSATADQSVRRFAQQIFGDRVRIVDTVPKNEPTANELVEQVAVACPTWLEMYEALAHEITVEAEAAANGQPFKAIVFLPTVAMVDHFERLLKSVLPRSSPLHRYTMAIHGQRSQASRQNRSDQFRRQKSALLITTDVVARGMDFPQVSHVFQLGVPSDVPSYVHRIGRTARIGNSGKSYLYYTNHVRGYLDALARERIVPKDVPFSDVKIPEAFHSEFPTHMDNSVTDEDEANTILNSLLSYMAVIKSKFGVEPRQMIADLQSFTEALGLEGMPMSRSNRETWSPRRRDDRNGKRNLRGSSSRDGYGSSRRTRMRW